MFILKEAPDKIVKTDSLNINMVHMARRVLDLLDEAENNHWVMNM